MVSGTFFPSNCQETFAATGGSCLSRDRCQQFRLFCRRVLSWVAEQSLRAAPRELQPFLPELRQQHPALQLRLAHRHATRNRDSAGSDAMRAGRDRETTYDVAMNTNNLDADLFDLYDEYSHEQIVGG